MSNQLLTELESLIKNIRNRNDKKNIEKVYSFLREHCKDIGKLSFWGKRHNVLWDFYGNVLGLGEIDSISLKDQVIMAYLDYMGYFWCVGFEFIDFDNDSDKNMEYYIEKGTRISKNGLRIALSQMVKHENDKDRAKFLKHLIFVKIFESGARLV